MYFYAERREKYESIQDFVIDSINRFGTYQGSGSYRKGASGDAASGRYHYGRLHVTPDVLASLAHEENLFDYAGFCAESL